MALYIDKANLAEDDNFIKRVAFAVAFYANYILNEPENTANHKARFKWASNAIVNPKGVAQAIALHVTMNGDVDANLVNTSDAQLQGAVEYACNQLLFG